MTTLFRQGWKAEEYFGDDVYAHHMSIRSVYRFHKNDKVSIRHDAPYHNHGHSDVSTDKFTVSLRTVHSYHEEGTEAHSTTTTMGVFDTWLEAYYLALEIIN